MPTTPIRMQLRIAAVLLGFAPLPILAQPVEVGHTFNDNEPHSSDRPQLAHCEQIMRTFTEFAPGR